MLDKIKCEAILIGHTKRDDWDGMKFNVRINGQDFDYTVGMGWVKLLEDKKGNAFTDSAIRKIREEGYTIRATKPVTKSNIVGNIKIFQVPALVKPPTLTDVLHCLFLDSSAHEQCFSDWCNECGYDNDSIKAKATYDACIENYYRLKKALGRDYDAVKSEIDAMEL